MKTEVWKTFSPSSFFTRLGRAMIVKNPIIIRMMKIWKL